MTLLQKMLLIFFAIMYIISFFYWLRDLILVLIPRIKCRNVRGCKKDDCPFRRGCRNIAFSEKEKAAIQKKLDEL